MSVEIVEEKIVKFLKSAHPEVLSIVGKWGIGKTFEWERITKKYKEDFALGSYAYVSLFGLNSLAEIKEAVFLNAVNTSKIGEKPDIKGYSKRLAELVKDTKIPYITRYVGGIGGLISSISKLSLAETVICFDDIERRSDGVEIKDFMGLVSFLKEQKKCKVVLLLNEDAGGKTFSDYATYKEKVVDTQIQFSPTPEYCFDTTFPYEFPFKQFIREHCISLQVVNRRVLLRMQMHINDHLTMVSHYDEQIQEQIVLGIVVLSWCYYCHGSDEERIPSLDYALDDKADYLKALPDSDDKTDKEVQWDAKLGIFDYGYPRPLLSILGKSIKDGFATPENLLTLCDTLQQAIDVEKRSLELSKAWKLFHSSFKSNEKEVAEAFDAGLRQVASDASLYQYSQGINVLRILDKNDLANELIDLFIEANKSNPDKLRSITDGAFQVKDEEMIKRVEFALKEIDPPPTVDEILERRRGTNSYNQKEADILAQLTEDEIYDLFLSFDGPEHSANIQVFILLSGSNAELRGKIQNVFQKIADASPLNKHRLVKFTS
ncbi:hypothetical protein [Alteromonas sp. CYL-A6]|uniref:hypothetical protein n=1 Tax=Alteromonas nitratireducens TaxID=3390813 RepID=UPI0034A6F2FE